MSAVSSTTNPNRDRQDLFFPREDQLVQCLKGRLYVFNSQVAENIITPAIADRFALTVAGPAERQQAVKRIVDMEWPAPKYADNGSRYEQYVFLRALEGCGWILGETKNPSES